MKFIIPRYAKSAATLLALSGDKLILDKPSELGPLDPQWSSESGGTFSPLSIPKTIEFLDEMEKKLSPTSRIIEILSQNLDFEKMGVYKASLEYAIQPLEDVLTSRMFAAKNNGKKKASQVAKHLITGYPQHGYPIGLSEASKLGLEIERIPADEWRLVWSIYQIFEKNYL